MSSLGLRAGAQRLAVALLAGLLAAAAARAQAIDFESNGLHYQALTRGKVTVMFAKLPSHVGTFNIMQVAVTNGSPVTWTVKPEDFTFVRSDGTQLRATPADVVIESLLAKASRGDLVKLQLLYESTIYALTDFRSTNGYEQRREAAMTLFVNPHFKAAAAASAITFVPTKLKPGDATDGAVFFYNKAKTLGPGLLMVHTGGEDYRFEVYPDLNFKSK